MNTTSIQKALAKAITSAAATATATITAVATLALACTALLATSAQAQVSIPANQLSSSRSVAYERNSVTGQITAETTEPGNAQHCLRKEYLYDNIGNLTNTTVKNCPGATGASVIAPRTAQELYNASGEATGGIFPNTRINPLGHAEYFTHDNRFGLPTKVTDANGLASTISYDSLGRKLEQPPPRPSQHQWPSRQTAQPPVQLRR
jgi:YD repeat-containing protein